MTDQTVASLSTHTISREEIYLSSRDRKIIRSLASRVRELADKDMDRLHFPQIEVDYQASQVLLELAEEIFNQILTVRRRTSWWWTLGMTWTLINNTYVGSGGFGFTHELSQADFNGARVRTQDMFKICGGFAESQEAAHISPDMFAEFIFPYQYPILDRFSLNCYGCCEPLNLRWHIVKKLPRLRRISVSPWADWEKMAEYLGDDYIYSFKPSPTSLANPIIDENYIRSELRQIIEITRGCRLEIIMKDNHTIGGNPQNVIRWCQIAREEAEKIG